ncbi:MAG TPA: malonyl-ACP O-methyltransferase BioC [Arenimonas sp.]|nr:malonyl-ACP O-methyltransferase BioC [Arenimonas sp.]
MNSINPLFQQQHIKQHFSRAAGSYLAAAALQKEVEARLLEQADFLQHTPTRILDLGSGPGRASGLLKKKWPKAEVIAVDIALPMLHKVPEHTRFWRPVKRVCANAMQLPFHDNSFDFVFSNLCLQWADPLPLALQEIRRVMRPEAMLLFSTFGPETLVELREAYIAIGETPAISPFAAMQQIGDSLQGSGFYNNVLDRENFSMSYADLRALMKELHAIGATDARADRKRGLMGKNRWQALNAAYPISENRVHSTWEVINAMAFKRVQKITPFDTTVASISPDQITRRVR